MATTKTTGGGGQMEGESVSNGQKGGHDLPHTDSGQAYEGALYAGGQRIR